MLRSYLLTAIRNIFRNKNISFINVFGLSFSMSIGMLIIVLMVDQYSYDNFIERRKDIYRIQTIDNLSPYSLPRFASTTFPLAEELRKGFSFIEDATAVNNNFGGEVEYNNDLVRISGLYAEENFFNLFNFNLIRGKYGEALKEPFAIILKENTAKKFFGEEDPIGKNITIKDYGSDSCDFTTSTCSGK